MRCCSSANRASRAPTSPASWRRRLFTASSEVLAWTSCCRSASEAWAASSRPRIWLRSPSERSRAAASSAPNADARPSSSATRSAASRQPRSASSLAAATASSLAAPSPSCAVRSRRLASKSCKPRSAASARRIASSLAPTAAFSAARRSPRETRSSSRSAASCSAAAPWRRLELGAAAAGPLPGRCLKKPFPWYWPLLPFMLSTTDCCSMARLLRSTAFWSCKSSSCSATERSFPPALPEAPAPAPLPALPGQSELQARLEHLPKS
mmetsp:Transcript_6156/g.18447  ORF Transcript_6156/g.18447 Transcript_6156/m.18447 type:complete len:267 (-) Transcript_6156:121-921(-)